MSDYLLIPHIEGAGEIAVFTAAILGSSLGFLWFNTYPASVFMGDVGSLPLGAALGTVAVISKHELLLLMVGGVFVIEAVSVIFQVLSFKSREEADFSDGAHPSSFRDERMGGAEGRRAAMDYCDSAGVLESQHVEASVMA